MIAHYDLVVPVVPPSFNEYLRWHWAKQSREREEWQKYIWAYLNERGHRCPRGAARVELHAVLFFDKKRRRDSDNFSMPLWKWTQDALVHNKIILDDNAERCTSHVPKIVSGEKLMTVVSLDLTMEGAINEAR